MISGDRTARHVAMHLRGQLTEEEAASPVNWLESELAASIAEQATHLALLLIHEAQMFEQKGDTDAAKTVMLRARAAFAWALEASDSIGGQGHNMLDSRLLLVKAELDRVMSESRTKNATG
jgi:hypothetical protein